MQAMACFARAWITNAPPELKPVQILGDRLPAKVYGDLSQVWTHITLHGLLQTQRAAHQCWCNVIAEGAYLGLDARDRQQCSTASDSQIVSPAMQPHT